ncbi:MAG TPA: thioredoxin [Bacteroidales bacterium]|nr:thioredoxin [Bacteroidales bacterium]
MMITVLIIVFVALLLFTVVIFARRMFKSLAGVTTSEKILILTDQNFSGKIKKGMTLVDFYATWCMPCKLMVPVLNEVAEDMTGRVTIAKLDVDEAKETASRFGVRSIPTMILFKNGREIHRLVGVKSKEQIRKALELRSHL